MIEYLPAYFFIIFGVSVMFGCLSMTDGGQPSALNRAFAAIAHCSGLLFLASIIAGIGAAAFLQ